jgi:hypothetical protein
MDRWWQMVRRNNWPLAQVYHFPDYPGVSSDPP